MDTPPRLDTARMPAGRRTQPDTTKTGHTTPWAALSHVYTHLRTGHEQPGHNEQPDTVNTGHEVQ
eukprot:8722005-Alexandrium_andersonii.AAC.1